MNITKLSGLDFSFEYKGETFKLVINDQFTSEEYKLYLKDLQAAIDAEDLTALSEQASFLFLKWNIEDNAGDIPLIKEEIFKRVPMVFLKEIIQQAWDAINEGKLTKKSGS
jgi:hypothetical protein